MSELKLKLEEINDETTEISRRKYEQVGLTNPKFYRWQRHAVNETLQIVTALIKGTQMIISVFAESGEYIPTLDELIVIKQHFLPAQICSMKCEFAVAGNDDMIVPVNFELIQYIEPPKTSKIIHNKGIIAPTGGLVN